MPKKDFFKESTISEIEEKTLVGKHVDELDSREYVILASSLIIPKGYKSARKFMKHGPEVKPRRIYNLEQAVREIRTPVQLREEAFNKIKNSFYCGYTFMPTGKDQRKRKVSLVECLEGARISAYAHQVPGTEIKIKPYDDAKRVRQDGAEIIVDVPSRETKQPRVKFKLTSVPIIDSPEKYLISLGIGSNHSCRSKRFNIRYRFSDDKEGSGIVNICAHEIAGYFAIIDYYINNKKNLVPLQMSQFAIPSQETVDFYLKLGNNVLVKDQILKTKDKLRKPNRAEKEIALWSFVKKLGYDRTFYSKGSRDGNLVDYNWGIKENGL